MWKECGLGKLTVGKRRAWREEKEGRAGTVLYWDCPNKEPGQRQGLVAAEVWKGEMGFQVLKGDSSWRGGSADKNTCCFCWEPGLTPSTHVTIHNHPVLGDSMFCYVFHGYCTYVLCTQTHTAKTPTQ